MQFIRTENCVDSTENGIPQERLVSGADADGSPDAAGLDGEDSETDEITEIFDLERLDFDDEEEDDEVID